MADQGEEVQDIQEGQEAQASQEQASQDAAVEKTVGDQMAKMFGDNDQQQQADELEQSGATGPDNPDGDVVEDEVVAATEGDGVGGEEEPTIEDLRAAQTEAAATGDYEQAIALRDQIKELEAATPAATSKTDKTVLDEAERNLMKELGGWADEDLKTLETSNPAFAKLTAKKLAESYNNLSLQYAQAARNGAPALVPLPTQQNATTVQQTATLESLYKDLDKFSEVAGNEMVDRFIKPLKSEVLDPLRDVISFVNEQRQNAVIREVNDAVDQVAKGGFEKHYGQPDSLTDKQRGARQQLYQMADMIHVGAGAQKVPMKYGEAIRRAHLILSAGTAKAQARTELVKQVKTRSTQITSRPSQRVAVVKNRGEAAAAANVEQFWQERE